MKQKDNNKTNLFKKQTNKQTNKPKKIISEQIDTCESETNLNSSNKLAN